MPSFACNRVVSQEPEATQPLRDQLRIISIDDRCSRDTMRKQIHIYKCSYLDRLRVCRHREGLFKGKAPKRNSELLAITSMIIGGVKTVSPAAFCFALKSEYDAKCEARNLSRCSVQHDVWKKFETLGLSTSDESWEEASTGRKKTVQL